MKKLMILGGHYYLKPVIEKAHELGIYVITVDYLPNNAAHRYSDEYHNISIIEKNAVLDLARKLKIDGITSFVNDVAVVTAAYVAEQLSLPFQCSHDAAVIMQDKGKFRRFLADHHFNVPHAKRYVDTKAPFDDIDFFTWPVIVKPTDGAGSKAVSKVESPEWLPSAIEKAVKGSRNGAFIIEDFLKFDGFHSSTDPFTVDGRLEFCCYSDQLFDNAASNPYAPVSIIWPTTMRKAHQDYLTREIQRFFDLLSVRTGIYNIETCVARGGIPYIMEISPRGGGCRIAEIQKMIFGVDLIKNEIRQAVGMDLVKISPSDIDGCWCEMVVTPPPGIEGSFQGYSIEKQVLHEHVRFVDIYAPINTMIRNTPDATTTLGDIFLHAKTRAELDRLLATKEQWLNLIIN